MNAFIAQPLPESPQTPMQQLAIAPQRVRTDEGTVEERPIDQLIQADVYNRLDNKTPQMAQPLWGISVASVRPPDSLGSQQRSPWSLNRSL